MTMVYDDLSAPPLELVRQYNRSVGGVHEDAAGDDGRAYGGVVRARKGKLVEDMTTDIVRLAWQAADGSFERLSFGDVKTYQVPIQTDYIAGLPAEIRDYINSRQDKYHYRAQVDKHVFIDGKLVMGIECKSYTENAMLKRILVDFRLLKSLHPHLICCLLQLESMLGGSYSDPLANPQLGSPSTHTLMSHFPEVELNIVTLLAGERRVDRPIHQQEYFKELTVPSLKHAISRFSNLLASFV
ncbi:MAG: hypothetical protein OXC62_13525 [Aestuariivita sp.]|nr:hypothetical protein [Aestuariivita sp.]